MSIFPYEIIENILYYCDGETLLTAELVCSDWKQIVQYLGIKSNVWERSLKDIPKNDLVTITDKIAYPSNEKISYETIFRNWYAWKYYKKSSKIKKIIEDEDLFLNVTCIRVSGDVIAFADISGCIYFINFEGSFITLKKIPYTILNIEFLNGSIDVHNNPDNLRHKYLLAHHGRKVSLLNLKNWPEITCDTVICDVLLYSYFQDNICFFKVGDMVTVEKLIYYDDKDVNRVEISSSRIFVRNDVLALSIWYDEIILLTCHHIFLCKYDINCDKNVPTRVVPLQKHYFGQLNEGEKVWMFQNNIVFNLRNHELQVVVFNIKLNKQFNCTQCLDGIPVKISYHGRILFICTNRGSIFTYCANNWSEFDLNDFKERIDSNALSITDNDIVEKKNKSNLVTLHSKGIYFVKYNNK